MATVDIRAEVSGTVWQLLARQGEAIAQDQALLLIESMKMEIPLLSPASGKLDAILVSEGEAVSEGQILARLAT